MPKSNSESDFSGSLTSDDSDLDVPPGTSTQAENIKPDLHLDGLKQSEAGPASPRARSPPRSPPQSPRSPLFSPKSPQLQHAPSSFHTAHLRGVARFRGVARKVMALRQTSQMMGDIRGVVGAEPGVDPRRPSAFATYGHIQEECAIHVADYNTIRNSFTKLDNRGLIELLQAPNAGRQPWVRVRWIHVGGCSWDVISALGLTYDLHPLSLEDLIHRRQIRSKADYFSKHLFMRVLCHSLEDSDAATRPSPPITQLPRVSSPTAMTGRSINEKEHDIEKGYEAGDDQSELKKSNLFRRRTTARRTSSFAPEPLTRAQTFMGPENPLVPPQNQEVLATIDELKSGDERVNVALRYLCVFLLHDGTVISFHQTPSHAFAEPIYNRLHRRDTVLRTTTDASLLVESILDLVVDQAVQVVDEYQKRIMRLEHDVLLKPKMHAVRSLHIISGDLSLHKRTMQPLKSLVYGLRRYDLDRCRAVFEANAESDGVDPSAKVVGYMSHKSKVYLADVQDHVEYILSSLEMFAGIAENLIGYTFNMASYEMNEVMRRLTLATIIFLPLTLLTGYFGMNFTPMWSVNNNSDLLFWEIAIPVMAIVIPLFMWRDFIRAKHFLQKKTSLRKIQKMYRD